MEQCRGTQNPEETTTDDHLRYDHLRYQTRADLRTASTVHLKPSGDQHRGAHGGSHRGQRSKEAQTRRYNLWRARRSASRQDYRQWKTHQQDVALKVHGNNCPPPIHLKPANQNRLTRKLKTAQNISTISVFNQTRSSSSQISLPIPTGTPLRGQYLERGGFTRSS